jgi:hypothetical protein
LALKVILASAQAIAYRVGLKLRLAHCFEKRTGFAADAEATVGTRAAITSTIAKAIRRRRRNCLELPIAQP